MKPTDIMTLVLFIVFAGCVVALIVFWYSGHLNYETSAAPEVFKKIGNFVNENTLVVYGLIILVVVIIAVVLILRIIKRLKRKDVNVGVMREMDSRFIPRR